MKIKIGEPVRDGLTHMLLVHIPHNPKDVGRVANFYGDDVVIKNGHNRYFHAKMSELSRDEDGVLMYCSWQSLEGVFKKL